VRPKIGIPTTKEGKVKKSFKTFVLSPINIVFLEITLNAPLILFGTDLL
jgi:hypothetical protein